jgi:hypothetical protein
MEWHDRNIASKQDLLERHDSIANDGKVDDG